MNQYSGLFKNTWESIKDGKTHGMFEYSNPAIQMNEIVTRHFKRHRMESRYGVYLVRKKDDRNVIYIGKGGTITQEGTFKNQNIPKILKASRGEVKSNEWFREIVINHGPIDIEYVFLEMTPKAPALAECELLQAYLNEYKKLPLMNKAF